MKRLIFIILVITLCIPTVFATEEIGIDTQTVENCVPEEASAVLPEMDIAKGVDLWTSVKILLSNAVGKSGDSMREALTLCSILLCVILLCSFTLMSGMRHGNAVVLVGALGLCTVFIGTANAMVGLANDTIKSMTDYNALLLPVLAAASAMSGGISTATALYTGTMLLSQLLLSLISKLLIPAVYCYLAISTAEAALENTILSELRELLGWIISKSLRIMVYIFIGFITLTGVISGAADATAVRATKATLSGMVPVVGGVISDASDTLLASASAIKSSVGVFGMIVVLGICIVPFLKIGIQYLLLKLTATVSGTVGVAPHTKLLKHFSNAMGYLLAMCGACCFLLLISCVCFIKVVV